MVAFIDDVAYWLFDRLNPYAWIGRMLGGDPPMSWRDVRQATRNRKNGLVP